MAAAVELELASSLIGGQEPDLVLIAGPTPAAFLRDAAEAGYAMVLLTGEPRRTTGGRGRRAELSVVAIASDGKGSV